MDCWQQIKQQLRQRLNAHDFSAQNSAISQYQLEFTPDSASDDVLAWLKGQCCYPQFFWQARESATQCVALGQVNYFTELAAAQAFLTAYPMQQLQLVGGLTFEGEAHFYLPRLWLEQRAQTWRITLTLSADDQQSAVEAFLQGLSPPLPLKQVQTTLRLETQNYSENEWQALVGEALAQIEQGHFTKVVLAQKKTYRSDTAVNPYDLVAQARVQHADCYYFLWAQTPEQVFLGASPERLYQRDRQRLITEALAGTAVSSDDPQQTEQQQQWLLQDRKNIHENRLVVEDICAKLANFSQHLDIESLTSRKLSYVQHLVRKIAAKLYPDADDSTCLSAIHPSAAVGGLPDRAALNFIATRQNFRREWYAGTLGVMSLANSEFCVAIRSTLLNQDKIMIFTGAGIVAGSVPLLEWQEIERKAAGILLLFPA
ncbi:isochorismate synthase MenF [Testudinibacter aquarius]|uniref:Isochorismate synthase MenF n=1 Tax=Testudinibacter aquarius TaxID=1524974 RepID=A0A4V2W2G9_9PAST|nr:isochorismate synthase [Testudinibacter aquarius]KAE9530220.1 hypothetical protein A1D24_07065 [Testudinibacter aquarius]TCV88009.1 isochorismate synthase [Testudinibacter aquarius]TNG91774.1 isochorismate synthase [Testudinibacter aquarius]